MTSEYPRGVELVAHVARTLELLAQPRSHYRNVWRNRVGESRLLIRIC